MVTSRSSAWPNAKSAVMKNQLLPPVCTTPLPVALANAQVSWVQCTVLGEQAAPVRSDVAGPEASITLFLSRAIWLTASATAEFVTSATASTRSMSNQRRAMAAARSGLFWWSATSTSGAQPRAAKPASPKASRAATTEPGPPMSA